MEDPKCPSGHALPNQTPKGQCTPLWCAVEGARHARIRETAEKRREYKKELKTRIDDEIGRMMIRHTDADREEIKQAKYDAITSVAKAATRRAARLHALGELPDLDPKGAEAWAKERIARLVPEAVQVIESKLKYGDDREQMAAAHDIMDYHGFERGAGGRGGTGPIVIINAGGGPVKPAWATQAIDTQVVSKKSLPASADKKEGDK